MAYDNNKWVESDASEEEEEEVLVCYMAIEEGSSNQPRHVSKGEIKSGK